MSVSTKIGLRGGVATVGAAVTAAVTVAALVFAAAGNASADTTTPGSTTTPAPTSAPSSAPSSTPSTSTSPSETATTPTVSPTTTPHRAKAADATPADLTATTTSLQLVGSAIAGQSANLIAAVDPAPDAGTVTFSVAGTPIYGCSDVTLSTGTAFCTTAFNPSGSVDVTATYSGDGALATSTDDLAVAVADRDPQFVGDATSCTPTTGSAVAVDFGPFGGPIALGCDTGAPAHGIDLLTETGFTTQGDQHDGPQFICRIGSDLVDNGAGYPTADTEPCLVTPPAAAYWSYWIAPAGQDDWSYSPLGAYGDVPAPGEVEAWVYGGTNIAGTSGLPTFTPAQVRAQEGSGATTPTGPTPPPPAGDGTGSSPDLTTATQYLATTTGANGVEGGTSLAKDGYYESGDQFADFGLTIDGGLALAATGLDNDALAKVVAFIDDRHKDGSGNSVDDWTGIGTPYVSGGSLGKEALLAEVTGYDPHAFGGHDLIAALDQTVCATKTFDGSCAAAGNYKYATSVFSQALGIIAQLRAGDDAKADAPIAYLESLQNRNGSFPSLVPSTGDDDVDSTAIAAMALALLPHDAKASAAVTKAVDWVAGQQLPTGGFPGAAGDSTNSTALAIQALVLAGTKYNGLIDDAEGFLWSEQNTDGGFNVSFGGQVGSDVRASTQIVNGVVGTSYGALLDDIAPPKGADAGSAAAYLIKQLVDGTHVEFAGGLGPDYGGTIDVAFALAADGGHDDVLANIVSYLSKHVADYADPLGQAPSFPGPYTGAIGKLAVLAEVTGNDPEGFGGFDLLDELVDDVCTAPNSDTCTAAGDFTQVFSGVGQALDVLALARGGRTVPAAALTRLESLQCADGGFSSVLITDGADCVSDVDTTGYAIEALALVPGASPIVAKAAAFLTGAQNADGGYTGASGENTNSTALAIQGLLAASTLTPTAKTAAVRAAATVTPAAVSKAAVSKALAWLATKQNTDGGFGISAAQPDSDRAATAQAVPAILGRTLSTLLDDLSPGSGNSGGSGSSGGSGTSTAGGGTIANTGTEVSQLLILGILLLLAGGLALAASSRRGRS